MFIIEDKVWDSAFFGFKTGELTFSGDISAFPQVINSAKQKNYQLLYWKIPVEDLTANQIASANNVFLGDTKTVFELPCSEIKAQKINLVKKWTDPANENLISLGISSGKYSRFKNDPLLPENSFEKMYREWVLQSLNGNMGDEIYFIGDAADPNAMITIAFKNEFAEIGLIAVKQEYQHQGYGKLLVEFVENITFEKKLNHLIVATQLSNLPAIKLYEKCGGKIIKQENIYHIWL